MRSAVMSDSGEFFSYQASSHFHLFSLSRMTVLQGATQQNNKCLNKISHIFGFCTGSKRWGFSTWTKLLTAKPSSWSLNWLQLTWSRSWAWWWWFDNSDVIYDHVDDDDNDDDIQSVSTWPRLLSVKSPTFLTSSVSKIKSHLWGQKPIEIPFISLSQFHQDAFDQSYILALKVNTQFFQQKLDPKAVGRSSCAFYQWLWQI